MCLDAQNLAVTLQVLAGGYLCTRCCGGKSNHGGYSFQTKERPACSDKGILFCIWLQDWETVCGCQNAGIWIFMVITGPNVLNHDSHGNFKMRIYHYNANVLLLRILEMLAS